MKFIYKSYSPIATVPEVMQQMLLLDEELKGTNLENLRAFNHTYYIITKNVYAKIGTNFFQKDQLMIPTDVHFAMYYFNALKNYVDHKDCPPAWKTLFETCKQNNTYQFIYMALGVNAHVNNDLPQTLTEVMDGSMFKNDFDRINDVIDACILEVIDGLQEKEKIVQFAVHKFSRLYGVFLHLLIRNWRNHAWKNYENLYKSKTNITPIEREAENIANILIQVTGIKTIPLILKAYQT